MTSNIVHLEPDPHVAVQQLLPWYINGRLEAPEREQVDDHLAGCPACRAELDAERLWSALPSPAPTPPAIDAGWARMQARVVEDAPAAAPATAPPAPSHAAPTRATPSRPRRSGWLGRGLGRPAAAAGPNLAHIRPTSTRAWLVPGFLSVLLAAGLAWTMLRPAPAADYHALAAAPVAGGTAVVRFRPDATEAQIRAGLDACDARIIDGPTVTGAYVVRVPRERYQAALTALRRQSAVALAEALEGADGR